MKNLENLKNEIDVINLEDRLEMVNLANTAEVESSSNGVCCCSDLAE